MTNYIILELHNIKQRADDSEAHLTEKYRKCKEALRNQVQKLSATTRALDQQQLTTNRVCTTLLYLIFDLIHVLGSYSSCTGTKFNK